MIYKVGEPLPDPTDSNWRSGATDVVIPDGYIQRAILNVGFLQGPVVGLYKGEDKGLYTGWSIEQVRRLCADLDI